MVCRMSRVIPCAQAKSPFVRSASERAARKKNAEHTSGYSLASSMTDVRSISGAAVRAGPLSLLVCKAVPALVPDVTPFIANSSRLWSNTRRKYDWLPHKRALLFFNAAHCYLVPGLKGNEARALLS